MNDILRVDAGALGSGKENGINRAGERRRVETKRTNMKSLRGVFLPGLSGFFRFFAEEKANRND